MALLGLSLIALAIVAVILHKMLPQRWLNYFNSQMVQDPTTTGPKSICAPLVVEKKSDIDQPLHDNLILDSKQREEDIDDGSDTPKAQAKSDSVPIPLFNLHAAEKSDVGTHIEEPRQKVDYTANPRPVGSSRTTPTANPMSRPSSTTTSLMPPPTVKPSALKPLPKLSGALALPPSAASTMRGPPKSMSNGSGLAPSSSTLPPAQRPSRKVLLEPGHSPLDWANLIRSPPDPTYLRGANVPPQLIKVTPSQLKKQNGRKGADAWGTYQGKVYNLSPYLKFHPGGVGELLRGAGKVGEAERLFIEIHPWVNWDAMLSECLVGILVSESGTTSHSKTNDLNSMD